MQPRLLLISLALSTFLLPSVVVAQDRVDLNALEDLPLYHRLTDDDEVIFVEVGSAGGVDAARGNNTDETLGRTDVFVGTTMAAVRSRTTRAFIDSFLLLPLTFGGEGDTVAPPSGRHHGDARVGMLRRDGDKKHGFEAFATLTAEHGRTYLGLRPLELGSGDFLDVALSTGMITKFQLFEDGPVVLTVPVSYELRDTSLFDDGALADGSQSHGVDAALGFEFRLRELLAGRIDLVGVRYDDTTLSGVETDGRPGQIEKIVVDGLEYEGAVIKLDNVLFSLRTRIGGAFISDDQGREVGTTIGGIGFYFYNTDLSFGLGFARDATWTADGERVLADNRVELVGHTSPSVSGVGTRAEITLSIFDDLQLEDGDDAPLQIAINTELYWDPLEDTELGAYYGLRGGDILTVDNWSPASADNLWAHSAGVFFRWTGDIHNM